MQPGENMQGSALTLGAAAMKSLLLPLSENRAGLCSGSVEVQSAKSECPSAISVSERMVTGTVMLTCSSQLSSDNPAKLPTGSGLSQVSGARDLA